MTYDELLALARRFEGNTLKTVTGRRFTVGVYLDCPFFTPASSGRGQSDGRAAAERFVARYNEIGSLRPGDYSRRHPERRLLHRADPGGGIAVPEHRGGCLVIRRA
ncbi:MAG: hypothetical protein H0W60_03685 [Chloroflexi bacterium]|nr:hypothetical protein [Chloroflexota bacterium]